MESRSIAKKSKRSNGSDILQGIFTRNRAEIFVHRNRSGRVRLDPDTTHRRKNHTGQSRLTPMKRISPLDEGVYHGSCTYTKDLRARRIFSPKNISEGVYDVTCKRRVNEDDLVVESEGKELCEFSESDVSHEARDQILFLAESLSGDGMSKSDAYDRVNNKIQMINTTEIFSKALILSKPLDADDVENNKIQPTNENGKFSKGFLVESEPIDGDHISKAEVEGAKNNKIQFTNANGNLPSDLFQSEPVDGDYTGKSEVEGARNNNIQMINSNASSSNGLLLTESLDQNVISKSEEEEEDRENDDVKMINANVNLWKNLIPSESLDAEIISKFDEGDWGNDTVKIVNANSNVSNTDFMEKEIDVCSSEAEKTATCIDTSKSGFSPCVPSKLFPASGSFSYRRMLPFLMQLAKENYGSEISPCHIVRRRPPLLSSRESRNLGDRGTPLTPTLDRFEYPDASLFGRSAETSSIHSCTSVFDLKNLDCSKKQHINAPIQSVTERSDNQLIHDRPTTIRSFDGIYFPHQIERTKQLDPITIPDSPSAFQSQYVDLIEKQVIDSTAQINSENFAVPVIYDQLILENSPETSHVTVENPRNSEICCTSSTCSNEEDLFSRERNSNNEGISHPSRKHEDFQKLSLESHETRTLLQREFSAQAEDGEKMNWTPSVTSKGILKRLPRGCRGFCTCLNCTSFRLNAERAYEFSKRQMKDTEELVMGLVKEISHLRKLTEKSIARENEMEKACTRARTAEEFAISRLKEMTIDLNIHCRIPRPRVSFADYFEQKIIPTAHTEGLNMEQSLQPLHFQI